MATLRADIIHRKLIKGDSLTNAEVAFGAEYFRNLANTLVTAGPVFHLAFCEANRCATSFEGFAAARARKY